MRLFRFRVLLTLMAAVAACGGSSVATVIDVGDGGQYAPHLDPAGFTDRVDNPYFPLPAGASWRYEERDGSEVVEVETTVLAERKTILGISAIVVRDVASENGSVVESTLDWYAQDRAGNVWYLGEDTKELKNGKVVSTKGSWEAGVNGAQPGIVMPAAPKVGFAYRQEYFKKQAEDLAEIIRTDGVLTVGARQFADLVVTKEWNPLEPKKIEEKYYAKGIGLIAERGVKGTSARLDLVQSSLR